MKKVYCNDCSYYQEYQYIMAQGTSQSYIIPEECSKAETKHVDTYKCRMPIKVSPSEMNKNNDCIYFEAKK